MSSRYMTQSYALATLFQESVFVATNFYTIKHLTTCLFFFFVEALISQLSMTFDQADDAAREPSRDN